MSHLIGDVNSWMPLNSAASRWILLHLVWTFNWTLYEWRAPHGNEGRQANMSIQFVHYLLWNGKVLSNLSYTRNTPLCRIYKHYRCHTNRGSSKKSSITSILHSAISKLQFSNYITQREITAKDSHKMRLWRRSKVFNINSYKGLSGSLT